MGLSFKCKRNIVENDLLFEGFAFNDQGIAGFIVHLPWCMISGGSDIIVLHVECLLNLPKLTVRCYEYLNGVIMRYAEVIKGPRIVYKGRCVELHVFPCKVCPAREWFKTIVTIYSVIPKVLAENEIKKMLKRCDLEVRMKDRMFSDFLENLEKRVGREGKSTILRMLDSIRQLEKSVESGERAVALIRSIRDGLCVLKEYKKYSKEEYNKIVQESYNTLINLEDKIKQQLQNLIKHLETELIKQKQ